MRSILLPLSFAAFATAQQRVPDVPTDLAGTLRGAAEHCANARITFWHNDVSAASLDPIADGRADADGRFAFAAVPWFRQPQWKQHKVLVVALAGDRAIGLLEIRADRDDLDKLTIDMVPTIEVTGTVQRDDGTKLANAMVWLWIAGSPANASAWITAPLPQWQVNTDAEGRFRMRPVPANTELSLRALHPEFEEQHGKVAAGATTCNFALQPGARVEGRVTLPDGKPAARVRVAAINNDSHLFRTSMTDHDGRYVIGSLSPGHYNVWADSDDLTVVAIDSLPLDRGERATAQDLRLVRGGRIVGRVVDAATGTAVKPGPWSDIAMNGPARPLSNGACQCFDVAADGTFAIVAPPGRNKIYLRPAPEWGGIITKWIDVEDGGESTVTFEVRRTTGK